MLILSHFLRDVVGVLICTWPIHNGRPLNQYFTHPTQECHPFLTLICSARKTDNLTDRSGRRWILWRRDSRLLYRLHTTQICHRQGYGPNFFHGPLSRFMHNSISTSTRCNFFSAVCCVSRVALRLKQCATCARWIIQRMIPYAFGLVGIAVP